MLPSPFQDMSLLAEVEISTWRDLLDVAGERGRFIGGTFTHQDLMSSLIADGPAADFYSALEAIQELGSDGGRNHIEQLAAECNIQLEVSASDTPPKEFVAQLLIKGMVNQRLKELLYVAQLTWRSSGAKRTYREYVGKSSLDASELDTNRLKVEIENWCSENEKSGVIAVTAYHFNQEWYCHVVRGDAIKRVMEVRDEGVAPLLYRPAATDLLRYDPRTGRIGIATRYGQMVSAYRSILGRVLTGDDLYFAGESICSLQPLQQYRKELFSEERLPHGILRVDLVELLWRRGDRDKLWVGGRDCFRVLDDLGANLREGEIVEAKLSIAFATGGRLGSVVLKVPNIIEIKAGRNQALVERLLDAAGVRGSFDEEGKPRTFWELFPWRLKEAEWRRRIGSSFDELLRRKTLQPVHLSAVTHPDHPSVASALDVVQVRNDVTVGVSQDHAIGLRFLTPSDVEGYELVAPTLALEIQSALELKGDCQELEGGLWSLGQRNFHAGASIVVFLCLRVPADSALAVIQKEAGGRGTPVLLFPECGHNALSSVVGVACRLPHGPYDHVLERIVTQLHWESSVAPNLWCSADLIFDSSNHRAWYRGILLSELGPDTQGYRFAAAVSKGNGRVVGKQELNALLSPSRKDDECAKQAKQAFIKAVKASYKAAALPDPSEVAGLFTSKSNGYALMGTVRVFT